MKDNGRRDWVWRRCTMVKVYMAEDLGFGWKGSEEEVRIDITRSKMMDE